jgi:uncharacterized membrane protein
MSATEIGLALSVFLACTVEAVEALTIVLAVGTTRSWSSALSGVSAATLALAAIVAALGPAIISLPLDLLRVIVGGLLLIFGLQWLRKAILRSAGLKSKHDERKIYEAETAAARAAGAKTSSFDGYAFTIAFKGVLLEGLEVAFIVLTFGANQHHVALAAAAAGLAILMVVAAGLAARAPLAKVPENTMKFAVGVMLSSFGTFWGAEGAGASWPGGDGALLAIIPGVLIAAITLSRSPARSPSQTSTEHTDSSRVDAANHAAVELTTRASALIAGVWEFVVGDDWRTGLGVVLTLALTALIAAVGISAWWVMPTAVLVLLTISIRHASR